METEKIVELNTNTSLSPDRSDASAKEETLANIPKYVPVTRAKRSSVRRKEVIFTGDTDSDESIESLDVDAIKRKDFQAFNLASPDVGAKISSNEPHDIPGSTPANLSYVADEGLPKRQLTLRERAEKLMRKGSVKTSVIHESVDMLHEKALATKTIDSYSEQNDKLTEKDDKKGIRESPKLDFPQNQSSHSPISSAPTPSAKALIESRTIPLKSGSPIAVSMDKDSDMPTSSVRALNAETKSIFGRPSAATGYQKGRAALSGTAETKSIYGDLKVTPAEGPTGASYATMSTLRSTKISNMPPRNGSQISLGAVESPKTPIASPKTFKEFYASLLRAHDSIHKSHSGQDKNPQNFKLQTIFGDSTDEFDPMDRLLWVANQYHILRQDPEWTLTEVDAANSASAPNPAKSKNIRIIDIEIDDPVPGLEIDVNIIEGLSMVISGSLKALFDGLIIPVEQDMSYVEVFLACYKFFTTPQTLFQTLEEWYHVTHEGSLLPGADSMLKNTKRQIQSRSIRVILLWIRNHWQDFQLNPNLMSDLECFTHSLNKISFGDNQKLIHAIREQKLSWFTSQYIPMFSGIKAEDSGKMWNNEMDTTAFAHNLTALDNLFFRQIRPDYYLRLLASEQKKTSGAYNIALNTILTYCGWFRIVVGYVPGIIAKEENTKKKTASLRLFLKIAKSCLDLGNYAGALAITFGLKMPSSLMWISAWEALPSKHIDSFKELCALADYKEGYKNYWDAMANVEMPAIPFIVPYMQDLVVMDKSRNSAVEEETDITTRKIHFQKFYDMFSVVAELETFRLSSYHEKLKVDKESTGLLLQHIRHVSQPNDDDLGLPVIFASGKVPEKNQILMSSTGQKAIKKAMHSLE